MKVKTKIGIVGCGAIGREVALFIEKQLSNNVILWGLADKDAEKAELLAEALTCAPRIVAADALIKSVDLVIETASVEAAKYVIEKALIYNTDVLILSVGALVEDASLLEKAKKKGINVYVPSGAICGVDGLGALSLGEIKKISLTTSKPPKGLIGARYLVEHKISLENLKEEKIVFKGTVKEAIKYFPQNINVAAILFLASSFSGKKFGTKNGKPLVEVCIKADPHVERNIHRIEIDTEESKVSITVENVPSKTNPKTSALAVLSTQYLLKKLFSSFKIGS
ncbi:MAG: aspartate dehydrogenase domain-containing protein [Candidatus Omnitrophota bacterium]